MAQGGELTSIVFDLGSVLFTNAAMAIRSWDVPVCRSAGFWFIWIDSEGKAGVYNVLSVRFS